MKYLTKALTFCSLLFLFSSLHAQDIYLNSLWEIKVGDREFVTIDNTERGLAYNPATNHVLLVSRTPSPKIHVIDADNGDVLGELSINGVSGGGLWLLNKIVVAEDGTIYAGSMTTDSASGHYRLYRWENEQADPVVVFSGDPSQGNAEVANRRFGDSLAVRGTGQDTEILLATWLGTIFSYLTPGENGQFSAQAIDTPVLAGGVRNLHFADGNFLYGSHAGTALYEMEFDGSAGSVTILRSFDGAIIASDMAPVAVNAAENFLVGVRTFAHAVALYRRSALTTEFTVNPVVSRQFPTLNDNGNATGAIVVDGARIFALDTNNGIMALVVSDQPPPPKPIEPVVPGDIYWTNANEIRTMDIDGSNPRTVLSGLVRAIGISIDPVRHHVYYADDQAGVIGRVNLDGTNPIEILTEVSNPQYLKVHNDKLYWAQWNGGLFTANLNGSDVEHLIDLGAGGQSANVVIGPDDEVYLGSAAGALYRPTADPATPEQVVTFTDNAYGMVWDDDAAVLYLTSFGSNQITYLNLTDKLENYLQSPVTPLGIDLTRDRTQIVWAERTAGAIRIASVVPYTAITTLISGENSPFGVVVVPELAELPAGFAGWLEQFGLPENQQGPMDDPDGDGFPNLLEYALGGDPTIAGSATAPVIGFESIGDQSYLSLAVMRNPDATGLDYIVEVSSDLIIWNSGEGQTVIVEETGTTLIVRDATPFEGGENKRFIRLRIEQN